MRWEQVFLSYDSKDEKLVRQIGDALERIGLEPFMAPLYPAPGKSLVSKIIEEIDDSNCFVPILTRNSISSQWVNQEIGYAISREKLRIFAVVESGLAIKGFVNHSTEHIQLDDERIDEAIYYLIAFLRQYIDRNWGVMKKIQVTCQCTHKYKINLPPQEEVTLAVKEDRFIPALCDRCNRLNNLSPNTFEIKESTKLAL